MSNTKYIKNDSGQVIGTIESDPYPTINMPSYSGPPSRGDKIAGILGDVAMIIAAIAGLYYGGSYGYNVGGIGGLIFFGVLASAIAGFLVLLGWSMLGESIIRTVVDRPYALFRLAIRVSGIALIIWIIIVLWGVGI